MVTSLKTLTGSVSEEGSNLSLTDRQSGIHAPIRLFYQCIRTNLDTITARHYVFMLYEVVVRTEIQKTSGNRIAVAHSGETTKLHAAGKIRRINANRLCSIHAAKAIGQRKRFGRMCKRRPTKPETVDYSA